MKNALLKQKPRNDNEQVGGQSSNLKSKKHKGIKKLPVVIAILVALAAAVYIVTLVVGGSQTSTANNYAAETVERRNITKAITGSGTLKAADSYTVSTLIEGEVLTAAFEEGAIVDKDSVLYEIDSSDVANSIEKAQISVEQSQRGYQAQLRNKEDLTITAPVSGSILTMAVKVGDQVAAGQTVATIRNSSVMSLTVEFPSHAADSLYVGQNATVTLDGSFVTLSATISEIYGNDTILTGNRMVREVKLDVINPGAISATQTAFATVIGVGSSNDSTFTYKDEQTVTAKVSGDVSKIYVIEGNWLNKGEAIILLTNDAANDNVENAANEVRTAQLTLDSQKNQLDSYTITSPINGTVIDKNYKVGDTVESGAVLCTIYDMSYMTMTLNVDELDIADVSVGQKVTITAAAVEGSTFEGLVTKVSVAGTTTSGVTTYPVTIRIDETTKLMPGMNVDADIVISQTSDVLAVPSEALSRDDKILITAVSPSAKNALADTAPEGYVYVAVTTGISDDDYVEIRSGLTEGDVVGYLKPQTASSSSGLAFGDGAPSDTANGGTSRSSSGSSAEAT